MKMYYWKNVLLKEKIENIFGNIFNIYFFENPETSENPKILNYRYFGIPENIIDTVQYYWIDIFGIR